VQKIEIVYKYTYIYIGSIARHMIQVYNNRNSNTLIHTHTHAHVRNIRSINTYVYLVKQDDERIQLVKNQQATTNCSLNYQNKQPKYICMPYI